MEPSKFVNLYGVLARSTDLLTPCTHSGDVETRKNIHTYTVGTGVNNQQVGNAWAPSGSIISLSMSGDLNIFDNQDTDKPSRVLSVRSIFHPELPDV